MTTDNKKCYTFHEFDFDDGFLQESVDATYIIHLENNGRRSDIDAQLTQYHPTNKVYLVINKGYKQCEKTLPQDKAAYDLTDAFIQIFKHARTNNNNHILILEDDFIFHEKILEPIVHEDINHFLNSKPDEAFVYYLGCIPYIQSMGMTNHHLLWLSSGTHACIYSRAMREHTIKYYDSGRSIIDWDLFNNFNYWNYSRYIYHEPVCYQLWTITENSKEWYNPFGIADWIKYWVRMANLDKQVEPGHLYFYRFSKGMFLLIVLLGIVITIYRFSKSYPISWGSKLYPISLGSKSYPISRIRAKIG